MLRPLSVLIALLFACACAQDARAHTVVIIVRHAEKAAAPADDPPLSEAGRARAEKLADIGVGAGVEAVFTSQATRARDTAAPLAARLGLTPQVRAVTGQTVDAHVKSVAKEILDSHEGKTVLVVGHSNTAPRIAAILSKQNIPDLVDATEFDALFVVIIPKKGAPRLIRSKY
ncbi:MAG TPA: phosphoglycerate mutase family protein [Pyrinomonadaceae bacterium]|nr:phosphoglycerate mutase family protein [Pyrinomonadaceae bacterium]